jgi:hypothetical protein
LESSAEDTIMYFKSKCNDYIIDHYILKVAVCQCLYELSARYGDRSIAQILQQRTLPTAKRPTKEGMLWHVH